jgi:hypothetical protein
MIRNQITISEAYALAEESYKDRIESAVRYLKENKEQIDQTYQGAALLSGASFTVEPIYKYNWNSIYVTVEKNDLKRVHDAIGRLKLWQKQIRDCKKRLIEVTLQSVVYPTIKIQYVTKLPRKAKCKIVAVREKARTYKTLVCST